MTSRETDAFLTYLGLIARWQDVKFSLQLTDLDGLRVLLRVVRRSKQDVVANALVLDPRVLLDEGHGL